MIYYFSGTGNSKEIAQRIAELTDDLAKNIVTDEIIDTTVSSVMGFVFPVYAWGMPEVMANFIKKLQVTTKPNYVFVVCTCGDDIGQTDKECRKLLQKKQIPLDAVWSIAMPNTYVALLGFDIDPEELAKSKIKKAFGSLKDICELIKMQKREIVDIEPGPCPWIKSHILRPLFKRFLSGDRKFTVNDSCTHCGICAKSCSTKNIKYDSKGSPYWNRNCTNCFACYHSCPHHAINYGNFTKHKGQYLLSKFLKRMSSDK